MSRHRIYLALFVNHLKVRDEFPYQHYMPFTYYFLSLQSNFNVYLLTQYRFHQVRFLYDLFSTRRREPFAAFSVARVAVGLKIIVKQYFPPITVSLQALS